MRRRVPTSRRGYSRASRRVEARFSLEWPLDQLEEGNATENGYTPGPPVMEFSERRKYIQGGGVKKFIYKGLSTTSRN